MKALVLMMFFTASIGCSQQKKGQGIDEEKYIWTLIENQEYTFMVKTILPIGAPAIQSNSQYDLQISRDSIISYLPYFGRAYSATIGSSEMGFQFTSTDFQYKQEPRKKQGWLIKIQPADHRDIQQMLLTVTETGSASLQVTSINRQPISYTGYIRKR